MKTSNQSNKHNRPGLQSLQYVVAILVVMVLSAAGLALLRAAKAEVPDSTTAESQEWEIFALINAERKAVGAQPLRMQVNIRDYARVHAKDMRNQGTIWHDMAVYSTWLPSGWRSNGENVALDTSVARIHQALMNSPGHKANILNGNFNYIGLGVAHSPDGIMYLSENFMEHPGVVAVVNPPVVAPPPVVPPPPIDTTLPSVTLTAPAAGSTATIGSTVSMAATASDNIAVTKVEFYNGATLLGSDSAAPYSFAWSTAGQSAGSKSLTARAYDAAGNNKTSAAITYNLTSAPVAVPGDANGDGRINALDLSILLSRDGQNFPAADFNKDGVVGAADLAILLGRWTW